MAASFGRIGGIFGPLLVGYLAALKVSMVAIFSIFCAAIIIGALAVLLFGQETKALELE